MFPKPGPFSRQYNPGMGAAVGVLRRSQKPGRHEETLKYSSALNARDVHSVLYAASAAAADGDLVWRSEKTLHTLTQYPTDSAWFNSFVTGFRARVGERRKQDAAISINIMLGMQELLEIAWQNATEKSELVECRHVAEHATFFLFLFCASMRGCEEPKVELGSLRRQIVSPGSSIPCTASWNHIDRTFCSTRPSTAISFTTLLWKGW